MIVERDMVVVRGLKAALLRRPPTTTISMLPNTVSYEPFCCVNAE